MKRFIGLFVAATLLCGCVNPKAQQDKTWEDIQANIRQAETWMNNHALDLVYPGDWTPEFRAEYQHYHRWVVVRDSIRSAKADGRDE